MTSSEIRDKLLEQRALYKQSLERSGKAKENAKNILGQIDDESIETLLTHGIDARCITGIDLERLQTDPDYVSDCEVMLDAVIGKLRAFLEDAINV